MLLAKKFPGPRRIAEYLSSPPPHQSLKKQPAGKPSGNLSMLPDVDRKLAGPQVGHASKRQLLCLVQDLSERRNRRCRAKGRQVDWWRYSARLHREILSKRR